MGRRRRRVGLHRQGRRGRRLPAFRGYGGGGARGAQGAQVRAAPPRRRPARCLQPTGVGGVWPRGPRVRELFVHRRRWSGTLARARVAAYGRVRYHWAL